MEQVYNPFLFITSNAASQYIYFVLAIEFLILGVVRIFERKLYEQGLRAEPPLILLSIGNFVCVVAFGMAFVMNGEHPRIPRETLLPYTRMVWIIEAFILGYASYLKTSRLIVLMRQQKKI